jgi:benzoyl-CoA reductase subunit B
MTDAYYAELKRAQQEGRIVAWGVGAPGFVPLLRAMDISFLHGEAYSAMVSARKVEGELKEAAAATGYLPEICSYARINLGCAVLAERGIPAGMKRPDLVMPPPRFIVSTSPGCSTETNWVDDLARRFGVPSFDVVIPFVWREAEKERAKTVVARRLRELVSFIEELTGRAYNWERLQEILSTIRKAALLREEVYQLCRNIPAPATFFDWAISLAPLNFLAGAAGTVEYFEAMKKELEERVARKEGAVPDEKYRLYWDGIMIWPKVGRLADKFAALGACVVAGRYTHLGFFHDPRAIDPERPLESIAAFLIDLHLANNAEWLINRTVEVCQQFSIDGLVVHSVRTCRPFVSFQQVMVEGVRRKAGIPGVIFEADHSDPDFYSEAQLDTKLQALLESIAARKKVG